jgi:hypothetical protein
MVMKICGIVLLTCICFYFNVQSSLLAQASNPYVGSMLVCFSENGTDYGIVVPVDGCWKPANDNWNGRFTKVGNKIENVNTTLTFPINIDNTTITAAKVNAYWDTQFPDASRIGGPTWSFNCYGHSTGLGYWVQKPGYSVVLNDDWQECTSMSDVVEGCTRELGEDHSIKISAVTSLESEYMAIMVSRTTEKQAYAGTYEKVYALPPGAEDIGYSGTYRPK